MAMIKAFTADRIWSSWSLMARLSLSSSAIRSATASGVNVAEVDTDVVIEVVGELVDEIVGDVDGVG